MSSAWIFGMVYSQVTLAPPWVLQGCRAARCKFGISRPGGGLLPARSSARCKMSLAHVPEKWVPVFREGHAQTQESHVPEKWVPVFREGHAQGSLRLDARLLDDASPFGRFRRNKL